MPTPADIKLATVEFCADCGNALCGW